MKDPAWIAVLQIMVPSAIALLGLYLKHRKQPAKPIENQPRRDSHGGHINTNRVERLAGIGCGLVGILFSVSFLGYNFIYPSERPRRLLVFTVVLTLSLVLNGHLVQSWYRAKPRIR